MINKQKVAQKYSKILNSMRLDHPVKPSLRSFLIYVNLWPDFVNKFLIAYENFISVDHVEFKFFDGIFFLIFSFTVWLLRSFNNLNRSNSVF